MFIRALYILAILAFYNNALAAGSCSAPAEPDCAGNEETYKNKDAYAACANEFKGMSAKTKEYIGCMKKELKEAADDVQKKADDATDKANSSMKKFNCRANPKTDCES